MFKKLWQISLLALLVWAGYQGVNFIIYSSIEVTSYQTLMKKSAYGSVSKTEVKTGAVDLIETVQCNLSTERLINHCRETFAKSKAQCLAKVFDEVEEQIATIDEVTELLRHFNACRRQTF